MKSRALKQRLRQVGTRNVSRLRKPWVPSKQVYIYITCISIMQAAFHCGILMQSGFLGTWGCTSWQNTQQSRHKCSGHWGALTVSGGWCPSIYAALQHFGHHAGCCTMAPMDQLCTKSNMTIKHAYKIPQKGMFSLKWAGAVGLRRSLVFGQAGGLPITSFWPNYNISPT